ncbi:hypothetical protein SRHO_G00035970 [Serrasalmus rhombeus]
MPVLSPEENRQRTPTPVQSTSLPGVASPYLSCILAVCPPQLSPSAEPKALRDTAGCGAAPPQTKVFCSHLDVNDDICHTVNTPLDSGFKKAIACQGAGYFRKCAEIGEGLLQRWDVPGRRGRREERGEEEEEEEEEEKCVVAEVWSEGLLTHSSLQWSSRTR